MEYVWKPFPELPHTWVKVTVTRKLKYRPNCLSGVLIESNGDIALYSYKWRVLTLHPNNTITFHSVRVPIVGHDVSAFLREYLPHASYQSIKPMVKTWETIEIKAPALVTT